jgi:hypothetical protein
MKDSTGAGRAVIGRFFIGLVLVCVTSGLPAATLTEHLDIECRQPEPQQLTCDYRTLSGETLTGAAAEYAGVISTGRLVSARSEPSTTAILFLVDTSDPARAAAVAKNREHIRKVIDVAQPHQIFGIASFDSDLELLCDIPCKDDEVGASLDALVAKGHTTELYRNVLGAIKVLKAVPAERHLLVLMSDGQAEDLAYHHEDVIDAARREKVVISSMGYPRSVAQSIALQTLRRLSEETGGLFAPASHIDNEIPPAFFSRVVSTIESGGGVTFDLHVFEANEVHGPIDVSLAFQTVERNFLVLVPVLVPAVSAVSVQATPTPAPRPPAPPPVAVPNAMPAPAGFGNSAWSWFWYGLPAMIFSVILAAAVVYASIARRRREEKRLQAIEQSTTHAFLVSPTNENRRHRIDHTPWRIGRGRNNELPLDDSSVSRLHAEIRRDALGPFTVQDLESLNGVFVNGQAIDMAHLDEGDRVEIGDVGFIFTFHDEDYARQEPTVLVRTITPT